MPSVQPLKLVLAERRISNAALARATGYSEYWVGLVANGQRRPGLAFMRAAAAELHVPAAELFREARALNEAVPA